tara:strand:+ start:82 stop:399 length:318 start_codon:yes stop_codon:yes gene_type:complete
MYKKITCIFIITFFTFSCGNTFNSVKRGVTGEKRKSGDEFLVKKKDPLILPPNYKNLPTPDERSNQENEISNFEKSLEASIEENSSGSTTSTSVEDSILKKIQSQ